MSSGNAANFRFSTDILRRLGEELNPTFEHGIVELAKNAYDADATEFSVRLDNTEKRGGTVIVVDNGGGMTPKDIRDGWLVIGQSGKNAIRRTPAGRIPAGYKGLGRLAALRLGTCKRHYTSKVIERSPVPGRYRLDRL